MIIGNSIGTTTAARPEWDRDVSEELQRIAADSGDQEAIRWFDQHIRRLKRLGWYSNLVGLWDPAISVKKDGNGAIATLYDLSGNDNDLTQSTTAKKPTAVRYSGKIFNYDSGLSSIDGTSPKSGSVTTQHSWDGKYGGSVAVDEASTNEIEDSEEFDDSTSWSVFRASVTNDDTTAPDGSTTADKLVEDTSASATHLTSQSVSVSNDTTCAWSVYVKADTRNHVVLRFDDSNDDVARVFIDLTNGAVTTEEEGGNTTIVKSEVSEKTKNGFYRCEAVCTPGSGERITHARISLAEGGSTGDTNYDGDGSSGLWLWGAQFEEDKSYATSYIPTSGSSASRSAGELKYDVDAINLSADEGTISCWVYVRDGAPHDAASGFAGASGIREFGGSNGIRFGKDSSSAKWEVVSTDGDGNNTEILTSSAPSSGWHQYVVTWDRSSSTITLYEDGAQVAENSNANIPASFDGALDDALFIGTRQGANDPLNSRLDALVIEDRAWTSEEVSEAFNSDSPPSGHIRQTAANDGSDDYNATANAADVSVADENAWACGWVNFDVLDSDQSILSKWTSGDKEYRVWYDASADALKFTVSSDGSATTEASVSGVSASTWHYWYVEHDKDNDRIGISLDDGTLQTTSFSGGINDGANELRIGATAGDGEILNGQYSATVLGVGPVPADSEITDYYNFTKSAFGL